jgi:2-isopropylmalate synthase
MQMLEIYDTTLRDGTQREGLSLTVNDKLEVARLIDGLGVGYIEGGWPGSNPKDDEFFARASEELELENAALVAFGSTCRPGGDAASDPQLRALLEAGTAVVCIVGKAWDYHVTEALRVDLDEGERMVADSIALLRAEGRRVFFDAEHFFDGYRADSSFALRVLRAAHAAGADRLVLCDTNGGVLPTEAAAIVAEVAAAMPDSPLGAHFHNDAGCAVANTLVAVDAGVVQVQGCVNGYGERTGNADLCAVIPNLVLKMGREVVSPEQLAALAPIAHHIAEITNTTIDAHHPYVGSAAFAHKAGLHTSALRRRPDAYEHIDPATVGNTTSMVVSELMGRATVLARAKDKGWDLDAETAGRVVEQVKALEHQGYLFEAADASFELLVRRATGWRQTFFSVDSFRISAQRDEDGVDLVEAEVVVSVEDERFVKTDRGDGPVHALDKALRAALATAYPEIEHIRLTDYRVRDLDSSDGTAARVRVLVETSDRTDSWSTVGLNRNIITASLEAVEEGIVFGLLRAGRG